MRSCASCALCLSAHVGVERIPVIAAQRLQRLVRLRRVRARLHHNRPSRRREYARRWRVDVEPELLLPFHRPSVRNSFAWISPNPPLLNTHTMSPPRVFCFRCATIESASGRCGGLALPFQFLHEPLRVESFAGRGVAPGGRLARPPRRWRRQRRWRVRIERRCDAWCSSAARRPPTLCSPDI